MIYGRKVCFLISSQGISSATATATSSPSLSPFGGIWLSRGCFSLLCIIMINPINSQTNFSWKDFEDAVFEELERVFHFQNVEIIRNSHIIGRDSGVRRQIDVLIREKKDDEVISTTLVECKHYATKINVKIVDSFIGCLEDVGAEKGIIVSEKGFTKAAINRAHKGKNDIEVDILSLGDLRRFQYVGAFPFCGNNALALSTPFGWIMDCNQVDFAPIVLYRRGVSFEEAVEKEKEWMYLQFWDKRDADDTLEYLIQSQNEALLIKDKNAILQVQEIDGLIVRKAFLPSYPTPEITVFKEFDLFIAFVVVFCPECFVQRDIDKALSILKIAIPIRVKYER